MIRRDLPGAVSHGFRVPRPAHSAEQHHQLRALRGTRGGGRSGQPGQHRHIPMGKASLGRHVSGEEQRSNSVLPGENN